MAQSQVSAAGPAPAQGMAPEAVLEQLLVHHVRGGAHLVRIRPGRAVEVLGPGGTREIPEHVTPASLVKAFVRILVADHLFKPVQEVMASDVKQLAGGVIDRDVLLVQEDRTLVRRTQARLLPDGQERCGLEFTIEPAFVAGYGRVVDPMAAPSDDALLAWLDDFITRLCGALPRVKDVIFSPNKPCPMVSLAGGLKEVEDVRLSGGGALTERIARVLLTSARSPHIVDQLRANGGHFKRLDLDLAFRTTQGRRCRVNVADSLDVEHDHGALITMRLLPERPWTLKELPLPGPVLRACMETAMGLVLIAGPTGSGKSTTMGVLIDHLLTVKSVNLLTIENPVETVFPPASYPRSIVSQRELGKHAVSLQRGLESAVRQTLDMAMVGEIRNAQDATMALELAKAGHLIFATVHAGTVEDAIDRVVDMYPPEQEKKIRGMLAAHLRMAMAQRLVRGLDGGATLILEYMRTNPDMQARILRKQEPTRQLTLRELMEQPGTQGCLSMDQALIRLMEIGKLSEDAVMFHSPDPGELVRRQSKLGVKLSRRWDPTGALIEEDMQSELNLRAKILLERDLRE